MAGLAYGLGVGPDPFILMSTFLTRKIKTTGNTAAQVVRALVNKVQLRVEPFMVKIILEILAF